LIANSAAASFFQTKSIGSNPVKEQILIALVRKEELEFEGVGSLAGRRTPLSNPVFAVRVLLVQATFSFLGFFSSRILISTALASTRSRSWSRRSFLRRSIG
jgi:hypothetical protein